MSRIPADGSAASTPDASPANALDDLFAALPRTTVGIVGSLARHPGRAVRAVRLLGRLRVLEVAPSGTEDGRALEAGLRRKSSVVRSLMRGATGVLTVPEDPGTYTAGNSRRTLRKRRNAAAKAGIRWERVVDARERADLVRLANDEERRHPDARYRNASPDNADLLLLEHWWLARDASGRPLLLAVLAVDGRWAMLRYFRTLQQNEDATSARFMMMDVLVHELSALGVRSLVTTMSPVKITPGLREFQHRVGFELSRVRILRRSPTGIAHRQRRLPITVRKS